MIALIRISEVRIHSCNYLSEEEQFSQKNDKAVICELICYVWGKKKKKAGRSVDLVHNEQERERGDDIRFG